MNITVNFEWTPEEIAGIAGYEQFGSIGKWICGWDDETITDFSARLQSAVNYELNETVNAMTQRYAREAILADEIEMDGTDEDAWGRIDANHQTLVQNHAIVQLRTRWLDPIIGSIPEKTKVLIEEFLYDEKKAFVNLTLHDGEPRIFKIWTSALEQWDYHA